VVTNEDATVNSDSAPQMGRQNELTPQPEAPQHLPQIAHPLKRTPSYRIFISTGEVSGDLQGALLIKALHQQASAQGITLEILALGGDRMAAAGATLLGNTSAIGSVGIFEALPYVLPTLRMQQRAKRYMQQHPPDLVVLIDYVQPNLALGSYLHRHLPQIPLVYYIAPQEWVWSLNEQRTNQIVAMTDRVLAIFPEEAQYFQKHGADVIWIGHPLVDRVRSAPSREIARTNLGIRSDTPVIALLPASRQQEVKYLLPVMFEAAQQIQAQIPNLQFWIPLSLEKYRKAVETAIERYKLNAHITSGRAQEVIAAADLAITKSGTVNLEIALLNVPQVVLYRVSPLTAWIAQHLLKFSISFMSPPNLVQMKPIVPEFLQHHATPDRIAQTSIHLLTNAELRAQTLVDYQEMRQALGQPGVCDRAAQEILKLLHP
jgi:lipid-A-disaccharide synthase